MKEDEYIKLAKKTLKILEITYSENENLESLLKKIENAMPFYSSSTEKEIAELTVKIAREIRNRGDINSLNKLLQKLEDDVSYLPWD